MAKDADQMGALLLRANKHANSAVPLLKLLTEPGNDKTWVSAAAALQLFFRRALERGEFSPLPGASRSPKKTAAPEPDKASAVFAQWLQARYASYQDTLLRIVQGSDASPGRKRSCVEYILELVRREKPGHLTTGLLRRLVQALAESDSLEEPVAAKLGTCAASGWDLAAETLTVLKKFCELRLAPGLKTAEAGAGPPEEGQAPPEVQAQNTLALLHALSLRLAQGLAPSGAARAKQGQGKGSGAAHDAEVGQLADVDSELGLEVEGGEMGAAGDDESGVSGQSLLHRTWALQGPGSREAGPQEAPDQGLHDGAGQGVQGAASGKAMGAKRKREAEAERGRPTAHRDAALDPGVLKERGRDVRRRLGHAWIALLRCQLPVPAVKGVLTKVHDVIPLLPSPLLLADFLTQAYSLGGALAVRALGALFRLMTEHSLEYPKYYERLYALLDPSIFLAKHRSRFVELLDVSLASPLLPAYLAAAFAKRLSRISLTCPTPGVVVIIALLHNLLRRHPSISTLVQHPSVPQSSVQDAEASDSEDGQAEGGRGGEERTATGQRQAGRSPNTREGSVRPGEEARVLPGADPYNPEEPKLDKCGALRSSLWELDACRQHFAPQVSRFSSSLEVDLTQRKRTAELSIPDFSSASYSTVFTEELGRRVKAVPLAFYSLTPSSLFLNGIEQYSGPSEEGTQASLFPGWCL